MQDRSRTFTTCLRNHDKAEARGRGRRPGAPLSARGARSEARGHQRRALASAGARAGRGLPAQTRDPARGRVRHRGRALKRPRRRTNSRRGRQQARRRALRTERPRANRSRQATDNFTRFFAVARTATASGTPIPEALRKGHQDESRQQDGKPPRRARPLATAVRDRLASAQQDRVAPEPPGPWDYVFYLDFEADPTDVSRPGGLALNADVLRSALQPLGTYRAATTVVGLNCSTVLGTLVTPVHGGAGRKI